MVEGQQLQLSTSTTSPKATKSPKEGRLIAVDKIKDFLKHYLENMLRASEEGRRQLRRTMSAAMIAKGTKVRPNTVGYLVRNQPRCGKMDANCHALYEACVDEYLFASLREQLAFHGPIANMSADTVALIVVAVAMRLKG